jgi:glycosyltransferase involved in cell wall biosynthesis
MAFKFKNICFFNSCLSWGGGEKWHFEFAKMLSERGYNVIMITNIHSELHKKISETSITHCEIKIGNLSFLNVLKLLKIKLLLNKHSIDSIILGLPSDVKIGGIAAKLANVNKIIYRRGTALTVKNSLLNKYLYRNIITDVITNSVEIQKKLLEQNPFLFPLENIHVIYNGIKINSPEFPKTLNFNKNKKIIIGTAGRIVEQKGHFHLIYLALELKKYNIDFEIQIAGKGPLKNSLIKLAEQNNVLNNINFLDFVETIEDFYNTIDIFVITSSHEGSANSIIEAMYFAKPIIAFNISSIPEVIDDNKNGLLVEYGNIKNMAEKIIYLINNPEFLNQIALEAKQKVYTKYNINNILQQLESII